ncbi:invasion associated locus B family protein [Kiloniella sp. b19]|uniref:invasion associated locus B family protein n=1 Tax=Kiloniella sp. GXU_MW_B19 TaxID=3141326 RepID=UPI0031D230B6
MKTTKSQLNSALQTVTRRCRDTAGKAVQGLAAVGALSAALLTFSSQEASAQSVRVLLESRDWTAYSFQENGKTVCYIASAPTKAVGNYTKRGDIFMLVTHRPAEKLWNEVSISTGYTFKDKSEVDLAIGKQKFKFFTGGDTAWAYDTAADQKIIDAMIKGSTLKAVGYSSRGTKTTDTYSLSGFTAAYKAINTTCKKP